MGRCSGEPTLVVAAVRVVLRRRRRTTRRYAVVAVAVAVVVAVAAEATARRRRQRACWRRAVECSAGGRRRAGIARASMQQDPLFSQAVGYRLASAAFVGEVLDAASCGSRRVSLGPVGGLGAEGMELPSQSESAGPDGRVGSPQTDSESPECELRVTRNPPNVNSE